MAAASHGDEKIALAPFIFATEAEKARDRRLQNVDLQAEFQRFLKKQIEKGEYPGIVKTTLDGVNQIDYLTGKSDRSARDSFLYYSGKQPSAVRYKNWKMYFAMVSDDPAGAWRRGDPDVIHALALLELRECGLRPPPVAASAA